MKKNANALRRLLALAAVLMLLVCAFAGCENTEEDDEPFNNLDQIETSEPSEPTETSEPSEPTEPAETEPVVNSVMGTVTTDNLNVRSSPSMDDGTVLMMLAAQTRVEILEQRVVDNIRWGRMTDGWVMLNYVLLDDGSNAQTPTEPVETPTEPADDKDDDKTSSTTSISGTISAETLNIRKGAGTNYDSVGKYYKGDKVTVVETKNGWGKTDKGWISMKYVQTGSSTTDKTEDKTETEDEGITTLVTDKKTKVLGHVTIDISSLNVRYGPGTKYAKKGYVKEGDTLAYYQEKSGWVRTEKGWVSLTYCDKESFDGDTLVTDKNTKALGTVTVKGASSLNIRYGPSTDYDKNGYVKEGDTLKYYQEKNGWVRTEKGWISLKYCKKSADSNSGSTSTDTSTSTSKTGTVTASSLHIRESASTSAKVVGGYEKGDKVTILETKDGWGKTDEGWISLDYVKFD